jgi:hypothetical protein
MVIDRAEFCLVRDHIKCNVISDQDSTFEICLHGILTFKPPLLSGGITVGFPMSRFLSNGSALIIYRFFGDRRYRTISFLKAGKQEPL